jgi:hypothetical protein
VKWKRTHYLRYDRGVTLNVMLSSDGKTFITKDGEKFPVEGSDSFPARKVDKKLS